MLKDVLEMKLHFQFSMEADISVGSIDITFDLSFFSWFPQGSKKVQQEKSALNHILHTAQSYYRFNT